MLTLNQTLTYRDHSPIYSPTPTIQTPPKWREYIGLFILSLDDKCHIFIYATNCYPSNILKVQ